MNTAFSPPVRRFAALALLTILVLIVWAGAIQPIVSFWAAGARDTSQARRLLSAYRQSLQDRPRWEALLKEAQDTKYLSAFLTNDNPGLIAAKFQESIKQSVESAGGVVQSIQLLPEIKDHELQKLVVRMTFSLASEALPGLLQKMELRTPYVFIDNLAITAVNGASPATATPAQLSIRCDFYAYAFAVTS